MRGLKARPLFFAARPVAPDKGVSLLSLPAYSVQPTIGVNSSSTAIGASMKP